MNERGIDIQGLDLQIPLSGSFALQSAPAAEDAQAHSPALNFNNFSNIKEVADEKPKQFLAVGSDECYLQSQIPSNFNTMISISTALEPQNDNKNLPIAISTKKSQLSDSLPSEKLIGMAACQVASNGSEARIASNNILLEKEPLQGSSKMSVETDPVKDTKFESEKSTVVPLRTSAEIRTGAGTEGTQKSALKAVKPAVSIKVSKVATPKASPTDADEVVRRKIRFASYETSEKAGPVAHSPSKMSPKACFGNLPASKEDQRRSIKREQQETIAIQESEIFLAEGVPLKRLDYVDHHLQMLTEKRRREELNTAATSHQSVTSQQGKKENVKFAIRTSAAMHCRPSAATKTSQAAHYVQHTTEGRHSSVDRVSLLGHHELARFRSSSSVNCCNDNRDYYNPACISHSSTFDKPATNVKVRVTRGKECAPGAAGANLNRSFRWRHSNLRQRVVKD